MTDQKSGEAHPTPPPAALAPERTSDDKRQWTLDNVYTVARREHRRVEDGKPPRPEMWAHVLRLCEAVGCQSRTVGVLREGVEEVAALAAAPPPARAEAPEGAEAERWRLAGERVGIVYGCDTPDWMAETILGLRAENARLTQALEQAQRPRPISLDGLWDENGRQRESSPCEVDQGDSLVVWYDDLVDFKQKLEAERDQQAGALDFHKAQHEKWVAVAERQGTTLADLTDKYAEQAETLVTLREALEPFARMADAYDPDEGDGLELAWDKRPTIGQLRQARATLAASAPEQETGR